MKSEGLTTDRFYVRGRVAACNLGGLCMVGKPNQGEGGESLS